jgi:hypothetical protein
MQTDPKQPDDANDPLDQLLAQACWPEPDAQSTQRLRRSWHSMRAEEVHSIWRRTLAVAAAVVLGD